MFGFGKAKDRKLSAGEVADWLAKHAGDVRTNSLEDARLFGECANRLSTEYERRVALISDFLGQ